MRDNNIIIGALLILGTAIIGSYLWSSLSPDRPALAAQAATEAGGPKLAITVDGQAQGTIIVQLFAETAPAHVERLTTLAAEGAYDGVVFHRVIDGFMAQTGDVEFGHAGGDISQAGRGASSLPDLPAEFSNLDFDRGILGMARSSSPDSANSQFFIMFAPAPHLNGQYTVVGKVTEGLEVLDAIKRGTGPNGSVIGEPDRMVTVRVAE